MAHIVADRVKELTTTTGTGDYALGGAEGGFQPFSAVASDGDTVYYAVNDTTGWEVGLGTVGTSGTTLARTTVISSSNSGAAVNWGAGDKIIFLTYPASTAVYSSNAGTANQILVNNGPGVAPSWESVSNVSYNAYEYTATEGQTTFTAAYGVGYVDVYLNGIRLSAADFTATNGTSVVLTVGATAGDIVQILGWQSFAIADTLLKTNNLSDLNNVVTARTNLDVDQAGTALALAIALG